MEEQLFKNILGYEAVKDELSLIRNWILNKELRENTMVSLPSGIIFYGEPGCGKTLFIREYASSFGCPIYVVEGSQSNVSDEIHSIFEKARENELAIICIDEIDLLIKKDDKAERVLQAELDGINQKGSILVLATTNHLEELSEPLTRKGRIDRKIHIGFPDKKSRLELFKKFISDFKMDDSEVNYEHIANITGCHINGADIKAICNDAYLRCKDKITTSDIETSFERIFRDSWIEEFETRKDYRVAIHECGHVLLTLKHKDYFKFYHACFTSDGGREDTYDANDYEQSINKRIANIEIGLAGLAAEKVIFGSHDIGSYDDLLNAHQLARNLVERTGICGVENIIRRYWTTEERYETEKLKRINEKNTQKIVKKHLHSTIRFLKKHKKELKILANEMMTSGELTYKAVKELLPNW